MRRLCVVLSLFAILGTYAVAQAPVQPKLVLVIVIDQFRYDYLTRFRAEYTGGFKTLFDRAALFTNAHYEHFPTVTAIGHSTILTGAPPSLSGIIGNDWYDRVTGKQVASVSDPSVRLLGGAGESGSSPRRLLVNSVGDELKTARGADHKVIGVSFKDRAAILPAGHGADAAYWFDGTSGNFVSSTYYFADLPAWVKEFNRGRADRYKGVEWMGKKLASDSKLYSQLAASPFGNELLEEFAEQVIGAEQMGADGKTDLLSVSFSSNDYVGHGTGPDSAEVHDMCLRTDKLLDRLFKYIDTKVGLRNVAVVLTADHGVAPLPEAQAARRMAGGRMPERVVTDTVQSALVARFGEAKWIISRGEHSLYLNYDVISQKGVDYDQVAEVARKAAAGIPHVLRVYTREELRRGIPADSVGRRLMNGFNAPRSADIFVLLEPYWMFGASGTTHGSAFSYDTHVPMIYMGPWFKTGRYDQTVAVNDIAPTLATLLGIETPGGSIGRCLSECFAAPVPERKSR
jgi:hypothetical protein